MCGEGYIYITNTYFNKYNNLQKDKNTIRD